MTEIAATDTSPGISDEVSGDEPQPRAKRIIKGIAWFWFAFFCLLLFTVLKAPEDRLKNYALGHVNQMLAPQGITVAADRGSLSVGWGISYILKDVTLTFPGDAPPAKIDKIAISPALTPMIMKRFGGDVWIYNREGTLHASVSMRDNDMSVRFNSDKMDLGKLGVLPLLANVKASGIITGSGSFSGSISSPSSIAGEAKIDLSKIVIDQQTIQFFAIPKISISKGTVDVLVDKGKATIRTLNLGAPGNAADDLRAVVTGDVTLGKTWETSNLNLKIRFKISDTIRKAFFLIDSFPQQITRSQDGTYGTQINGTMYSINAVGFDPGTL